MRDHLSSVVMADHIFLAEGSAFQYNWTCHQKPPVLTDHIFVANGPVFQERFYCIMCIIYCRHPHPRSWQSSRCTSWTLVCYHLWSTLPGGRASTTTMAHGAPTHLKRRRQLSPKSMRPALQNPSQSARNPTIQNQRRNFHQPISPRRRISLLLYSLQKVN